MFRGQLSDEEYNLIFPRTSAMIHDVERAVFAAKEKYENRSPHSKIRKWLSSCSKRVIYYGAIMDTLSQHHPEYVSLAWGALKFLFIAVINHEELLVQISKTVSRIADVLPRTELASSLYQTDRMNRAVAHPYVKIMRFVQDAVKWYKMGKFKHSITSITRPYDLSFKEIIEEIDEASRNVDKEASAASRAEIRGLHLQVIHLTEISKMNFDRQLSMSTAISSHLADQSRWIQSSQIAQIRSLKTITSLPSPTRSLDFCRSLRNRRMSSILIDQGEISKLQRWHTSQDASSALVAQARGLRTTATDFAVDYVDILRAHNTPIIWLVPHTNVFDEEVCSLSDLLLVLIMQILELYPRVLLDGSFPVTINHFQDIESQESEAEDCSFDLLARCLEGVERLYILVEMTLVNAVVNDNSTRARAFLRRLQLFLLQRQNGGIKLVLVSWKSVRGQNDLQYPERSAKIYVDGPVANLSRRKVNHRALSIGRAALSRSLY